MTGHQARMLAIGDHVVWTRPDEPLAGRVAARGKFSLTIRWADGTTSEMFYNDMKHVERPQNVDAKTATREQVPVGDFR